ncbi:MAG: glycoside hydrolase family 99-like domain-containing protein [Fimbriimonadaceae bacterium]|nr:glycoside hydrolase family 99-like domain-containing protein [Fimbriimonadaceae bacterium]
MGWSSCLALTALLQAGVAPADAGRVLVGAIRWDCWYGEGQPVDQVESTLGQRKYQWRLPWFAEILGPDAVRLNGDQQETIDREIALAVEAGLDYWAFVDYGDEGNLTIARRRYQASTVRQGLRYCFVEEGGRLDGRGVAFWPRLVQHFQTADYVKVLGNRPLLFIFGKPNQLTKADFVSLGDQAVAAGLGRPYLAFMGWWPPNDAAILAELGFDAWSAYAAGGQYAGAMLSYADLTAQVRQRHWELVKQHKLQTITFATTGWDTRPRIERPPTWFPKLTPQPDPTPPEQQQPLRDAVNATPEQLTAHVREALAWTRANPETCPAQAMILYAWNENDEGGWLTPTHGEGDARIRAVAAALRPAAP